MSILKTAAVLAATAAAVAASAGTAQAADTVFLYTGTNAHCSFSGGNGVSGGVFSSYTCKSGFAGYSLLVTGAPGWVSGVYVNTFDTLAQCDAAGDNGEAAFVFTSHHCQSGIAGYSLTVSG